MSAIERQIQQASARNVELLSTLAKTDHAAPVLKGHVRFIDDLVSQIQQNDAKLEELEKKRVSELADHEKYRDSNVRRFFSKATGQGEKFEAKAAKEEQEYMDVLQEQHQTTVFNNGLKQQLEDARKIEADLQAVDKVHHTAQLELDNLYNSIFGGATADFPQEDKLEQKSNSALQAYHDIRERQEELVRVVALLEKSSKSADVAISHMKAAHGASRYDLFGGSTFADAMERSQLSQADIAHREALHAAQSANVNDLPSVKFNHGHILRDILFDSLATDLQFHNEIKRAEGEVQAFARAVLNRKKTSEETLATVSKSLKDAEKELEDSRATLQAERQRLFEQCARGSFAKSE